MFLFALLGMEACGQFEYQGWLNEPVPIKLAQDMPLAQMKFLGGSNIMAVVDTNSPFNVVSQNKTNASQSGELRLQDGAHPEVTRFIFPQIEVYDFNLNQLGLNDTVEAQGIIGAPLLQNFAVHFSYGTKPTVTLSDGIPDTDQELATDCSSASLFSSTPQAPPGCWAVISTPLHGGGSLLLGENLVDVPASRLVVPLCLLPDPLMSTPPASEVIIEASGLPVMGIVATGLPTSIITRSAWQRLGDKAKNLAKEKGTAVLHLPSGDEEVSLASLERIALVSDESFDRGPCGELARRRRLQNSDQAVFQDADKERNGASVAMLNLTIEVAIIADESPLIQGLRQELRPYTPDADLLLGGDFLKNFEVEIDYPDNRLILQCAKSEIIGICEIIPWCGYTDDPLCPAHRAQD